MLQCTPPVANYSKVNFGVSVCLLETLAIGPADSSAIDNFGETPEEWKSVLEALRPSVGGVSYRLDTTCRNYISGKCVYLYVFV